MSEPIKAEVFTRHSTNCKYKTQRYYRNCYCRKWIHIFGKDKRISAKTRSWEIAEEKRKHIEQGELVEPQAEGADADDAIHKVVTDFLAMKKTVVCKTLFLRYERELKDFETWLTTKYDHPILHFSDITKALPLEKYQLTWKAAPVTKNNRRTRLKAFWDYAVLHKLAKENYARHLPKFPVKERQTPPLSPKEFERLLAAVDRYDSNGHAREYQRQRVRTMLLLLRWSGLRITDAAKLERSRIDRKTNNLRLRTGKTGTPINVPLPSELVQMLFRLPNVNEKYFFWTGQSAHETLAKAWGRTMRALSKLAGVKARAHMLRDTFAVEALKSRQLTLLQVSKILGHSSVKITEKYYLEWVPELQDQLEQGVRAMWPESILAPTTEPITIN